MDNQEIIQAHLREIALIGQAKTEQLEELIHRQHYNFAHKIVPYLVWEHFDELISAFEIDYAQEWINEIWSNLGDAPLKSFSVAVYPRCQLRKLSEDIGVIYFAMPAPRTTTEVVYSSVLFLMEQKPSSMWLRRYFTLELSAYADWILGEWDDTSTHSNYGEFPLAPTLSNFLSKIIDMAKRDWY